MVCALRFFYGVTLGQDTVPERIAYAREPSKLPVVLSADEVVRFLEAIPSLKSRIALTTVYAAGLLASHRESYLERGDAFGFVAHECCAVSKAVLPSARLNRPSVPGKLRYRTNSEAITRVAVPKSPLLASQNQHSVGFQLAL